MKSILLSLILLILMGVLWADIPQEEQNFPDVFRGESVERIAGFIADDINPGKFLVALILSIMIEFIVIAMLYKPLLDTAVGSFARWARLFAIVAGATCVTINILWRVLPRLLPDPVAYLVLGELFVLVVEGLAYKLLLPCKWRPAFVLSTVANLASFFLGFLLMGMIF